MERCPGSRWSVPRVARRCHSGVQGRMSARESPLYFPPTLSPVYLHRSAPTSPHKREPLTLSAFSLCTPPFLVTPPPPSQIRFKTDAKAPADKKKVQPLSFGIVTRVKDGVAFARDLGFASFGELVIFVPSPARLKSLQASGRCVHS